MSGRLLLRDHAWYIDWPRPLVIKVAGIWTVALPHKARLHTFATHAEAIAYADQKAREPR